MKKILFSVVLLLLFSCSVKEEKSGFCFTPPNDGAYELMEHYFSKNQKLTHNVHVHYFSNGKKDVLSDDFIENRVLICSDPFKDRKFEVVGISRYGVPENDTTALDAIFYLEKNFNKGGLRKDLRSVYHILHFKWWSQVYDVPNAINLYIYDNISDGYAGVANGIGSRFISIRRDYIGVENATLEHELGHALGLAHTHSEDKTNGFNNKTGDKVWDTLKTPSDLFKFMDENCQYTGNLFEGIPVECQEKALKNYMAYNSKNCRSIITDGQVDRYKSVLENNADLRSTVKELLNNKFPEIPEKYEVIPI